MSDPRSVEEPSRRVKTAEVRERKPWLAALLSIVTIGLGHLYAGRPWRALVALVASSAAAIALLALSMQLRGFAQLGAYAVAAIGPLALSMWDAASVARAGGSGYRLRWYNRWYVYVGLAVLGAFAWRRPMKARLLANVVEAFTIPAGSMAPTIEAGDVLFTRPWRGDVQRGDIVAYRRPHDIFLGRIVGLPRDTIAMSAGTLLVDGHASSEPYARPATADTSYAELAWQSAHLAPGVDRTRYRPTYLTWGPIVVPVGHYFVLGDNRGDSRDSRLTGFVPRDSIVKQPTTIYFSRDPDTREIRWNRIGRDLRR